ncbi:hypothetical protein LINGRAHAP2_LOCUS14547, partial [Linum grandiflorum]
KQSRVDKSEPSRAEVYIRSHVRSNGRPLNIKVVETVEALLAKEMPKTGKGRQGKEDVEDTGDLDLLAQVTGRDKSQ